MDLKAEHPLYATTRVGQTLAQSLEQAHVLAGLAAQRAGWPATDRLKGNMHLTIPRERSSAGPIRVTHTRLYTPDPAAAEEDSLASLVAKPYAYLNAKMDQLGAAGIRGAIKGHGAVPLAGQPRAA